MTLRGTATSAALAAGFAALLFAGCAGAAVGVRDDRAIERSEATHDTAPGHDPGVLTESQQNREAALIGVKDRPSGPRAARDELAVPDKDGFRLVKAEDGRPLDGSGAQGAIAVRPPRPGELEPGDVIFYTTAGSEDAAASATWKRGTLEAVDPVFQRVKIGKDSAALPFGVRVPQKDE